MKITVLLVERSLVTSLRQAAEAIPDLELALHFASEPGWDAIAEDVRTSLAVFAVHITDQAAADTLVRLVNDAAPSLQAFVPLNCVGSLMRQARLGKLRLAGERGFMSRFGKLIRRPTGERSAESYADFVSRVARLLRFAPGRGQDFRTYLLLYSYYLNASPENLRSMLALVLQRYGGLPLEAPPPLEYPREALYHPDAPRLFSTLEDYLAWFHGRPEAPRLGAPQVDRKSVV